VRNAKLRNYLKQSLLSAKVCVVIILALYTFELPVGHLASS
jgi:hypothetical protein